MNKNPDQFHPPQRTVKLFAGASHGCGYLPAEVATTQFVDPSLSMNPALYSELVDLGFRRSGELVYRPRCRQCVACVPMRIPVAAFTPSRRQRRTWQRNQDLQVHLVPARFNAAHFDLYRRYIAARHPGGGMDVNDPAQYESFFVSPWSETWCAEIRDQDRLLAVAVIDRLQQGWSAVYTYFDPAQARRSLGGFAVLWQIEECRRLGLPWLYLGYWVEQSPKMAYKNQFQPMEVLRQGGWQPYLP
ncbi:MAG: arginyltransferase [Pseudomonadota bacterium]